MKLPITFFYSFFKENQNNKLLVIDRTVYTPTSDCNSDTIVKTKNHNFYFNGGIKLSKLEEMYFKNYDTELKRCGNEIIKNCLAYEKEIDYHKLGQNVELTEFMLYKVIDYKKEESKAKIIDIKSKNTGCCLIDHLIGKDFFVDRQKFYELHKGKDSIPSRSIKVKNQDYKIGEESDLNIEDLEKKYLEIIEEKIYNDLTKGQGSLVKKINNLTKKKDVFDIIKKGEFYDLKEKKGIKISDEGFFATIKSKNTYVLHEGSNGKCYRFGEALIGVKLTKEGDKIRWNEPVVINPYIHPGLPYTDYRTYQKICKGDYDYNKAIRGQSLERAIRILLEEGKRMLENGYYMVEIKKAWHQLTEEPFQKLETKNFTASEITNFKEVKKW